LSQYISLSFIIATYNRSKELNEALQSFTRIDNSILDFDWDIIVVDNNSSDDTRSIVDQFNKSLSIKYCFEARPGVSYARNAGVETSRANFVVFLDDDARVTTSYVKNLSGVLALSPDVFGGPIYPYYAGNKPSWFKDEYEIRKHYPTSDWIPSSSQSLLSSSNMGFSKDFFKELGGFDTSLGPKGEKFSLGEDGEIIVRSKYNKGKIYYDHHLVIEHLVPDYKMNLAYQLYRAIEHGKANVFLNKGLESSGGERIWDHYYALHSGLATIEGLFEEEYRPHLKDQSFDHEAFIVRSIVPELINVVYHYKSVAEKTKKKTLGDSLMNLNLFTVINKIKIAIKAMMTYKKV